MRNHAAGDCLETTEHLAGLVGGDLTAVQETRVCGHLAECATCRGRLAELDDLGLSRRRAAMPLGLVLGGRSLRRRLSSWRSGGTTRLAGVDPSVPEVLSAVVSSPAVSRWRPPWSRD